VWSYRLSVAWIERDVYVVDQSVHIDMNDVV
jgi:hypothetical protein